jgi:hypothetical protein
MFPTGYHWITIELILYYRYVSVNDICVRGNITRSSTAICKDTERLKNFYQFCCGNIEVQK